MDHLPQDVDVYVGARTRVVHRRQAPAGVVTDPFEGMVVASVHVHGEEFIDAMELCRRADVFLDSCGRAGMSCEVMAQMVRGVGVCVPDSLRRYLAVGPQGEVLHRLVVTDDCVEMLGPPSMACIHCGRGGFPLRGPNHYMWDCVPLNWDACSARYGVLVPREAAMAVCLNVLAEW